MVISEKCECPDDQKRIVFADKDDKVGIVSVSCLSCGAAYHDKKENTGSLDEMTRKEFGRYAKTFHCA